MSEPEVQHCAVMNAPADWPRLQVRCVTHPLSADLKAGREAARQRVRHLLLREAGPEIATPFLAAPRESRGACRVSISHEQSHSVLAWCEQGCIGIDTVSPQRFADMAPPALAALASLYLGPKVALEISRSGEATAARMLFADAWARHEARLKCLGLALDEWSPTLQVELAGCLTAQVSPPAQDQAGAGLLVTWIAWRKLSNPSFEHLTSKAPAGPGSSHADQLLVDELMDARCREFTAVARVLDAAKRQVGQ